MCEKAVTYKNPKIPMGDLADFPMLQLCNIIIMSGHNKRGCSELCANILQTISFGHRPNH